MDQEKLLYHINQLVNRYYQKFENPGQEMGIFLTATRDALIEGVNNGTLEKPKKIEEAFDLMLDDFEKRES